MIVVVEGSQSANAERALRGLGLWTRRHHAGRPDRVAFHVSSSSTRVAADLVRAVDGVIDVFEVDSPHPLVDAMNRLVSAAVWASVGKGKKIASAAPRLIASDVVITGVVDEQR